MKFLLVNDDGIDSPRLQFTKNVLSKYGDVVTVAPKHEQSGKSMSITLSEINYEEVEKNTYAVDGTPVDCVSFGIFALNYRPDYIISGINKGFNIGIDILYSGTVGAAIQGCYYGFKALAFSGDSYGQKNMVKYFESTLNHIIDNDLASKKYVLNINFPKEKFEESAIIVETEPHFVQMRLVIKIDEKSFSTRREIIKEEVPSDSDVYALRCGNISISKVYLKR